MLSKRIAYVAIKSITKKCWRCWPFYRTAMCRPPIWHRPLKWNWSKRDYRRWKKCWTTWPHGVWRNTGHQPSKFGPLYTARRNSHERSRANSQGCCSAISFYSQFRSKPDGSRNYDSYINQHNWALRSKKIIFILWIIDPFDDRWFIFQLEVHESSGHFPEGLFTDRNTNAIRSYGLFDECIDTQGPAINGKYCTIFFNIEEVRPEELDNSTIRQIQESGNWNT